VSQSSHSFITVITNSIVTRQHIALADLRGSWIQFHLSVKNVSSHLAAHLPASYLIEGKAMRERTGHHRTVLRPFKQDVVNAFHLIEQFV